MDERATAVWDDSSDLGQERKRTKRGDSLPYYRVKYRQTERDSRVCLSSLIHFRLFVVILESVCVFGSAPSAATSLGALRTRESSIVSRLFLKSSFC